MRIRKYQGTSTIEQAINEVINNRRPIRDVAPRFNLDPLILSEEVHSRRKLLSLPVTSILDLKAKHLTPQAIADRLNLKPEDVTWAIRKSDPNSQFHIQPCEIKEILKLHDNHNSREDISSITMIPVQTVGKIIREHRGVERVFIPGILGTGNTIHKEYLSLREQGLNHDDTCNTLILNHPGITRRKILDIINKRNTKSDRHKFIPTADHFNRITQHLSEHPGSSLEELSEHVGIPWWTLRKFLMEHHHDWYEENLGKNRITPPIQSIIRELASTKPKTPLPDIITTIKARIGRELSPSAIRHFLKQEFPGLYDRSTHQTPQPQQPMGHLDSIIDRAINRTREKELDRIINPTPNPTPQLPDWAKPISMEEYRQRQKATREDLENMRHRKQASGIPWQWDSDDDDDDDRDETTMAINDTVDETTFINYLIVQHSGIWNMITEADKACESARISANRYKYICRNYQKLLGRFPGSLDTALNSLDQTPLREDSTIGNLLRVREAIQLASNMT